MKAKKTGNVEYGKWQNLVEFEYRGYKYWVEYAKGDYICPAPRIQHGDKQYEIDRMIEDLERQKNREYRYEDTAEYGLELFFWGIGREAFLEKFNDEYDFLYKNHDQVAGYREAVKWFDEFCKTHSDIISDFCELRKDLITSDREAAAFAFAWESSVLWGL